MASIRASLSEIRHAAEHVPGLARLVNVKARWLGHKLAADVTIAVDQELSVTEASKVAVALKEELARASAPAQLDNG